MATARGSWRWRRDEKSDKKWSPLRHSSEPTPPKSLRRPDFGYEGRADPFVVGEDMSEEEKVMSEARQFTILVERVEHELKPVAEGHKGTQKKVDDVKEELLQKIEETNLSVKFLGKELQAANQRIDGTNQRIDGVIGALKTHGIAVVAA